MFFSENKRCRKCFCLTPTNEMVAYEQRCEDCYNDDHVPGGTQCQHDRRKKSLSEFAGRSASFTVLARQRIG